MIGDIPVRCQLCDETVGAPQRLGGWGDDYTAELNFRTCRAGRIGIEGDFAQNKKSVGDGDSNSNDTPTGSVCVVVVTNTVMPSE